MNRHVFTTKEVIAERNKRLMAWIADELELEDTKRQQLYEKMTMLFGYVTDNRLRLGGK
jgi:hypothetical protein